ncbi:MAG: nucleotide sugar dehydrogenase [Mycobacteriales bacterium]
MQPEPALGPGPPADIAVVGGGGHVGLPLSIALADRGATVLISDTDTATVDRINRAAMPFLEPGAPAALARVIADARLTATSDPAALEKVGTVVVVIGTPVDEHLNPDFDAIPRALAAISDYLRDGQLIVLRSTVYPGVTKLVERTLAARGLKVDVAFCPERIAEGKAMSELYELPQIVGARDDRTYERAAAVFSLLTDKLVRLDPEEAELAKLITNNWRYLKFAAANQFYMIANNQGLDYERIRLALIEGYPRASGLPRAGFAAGPCLFKDTMQLAAFNDNNYFLGHSAMLVNEGLPLYVIRRLEERFDLSTMRVGILGMAFKSGSDDVRASLSYKLRRILAFRAAAVLCTDPYVSVDPDLLPLDRVLTGADLLIVGAPHPEYRELAIDKPVADVWGILGQGVRI